ncbi:IQ domain-containing protein E isoform X1 [Pseudophryne corroboree]|uniref:IQ domain-containing protein E isoform X1 n=1 Tax=Pseudophryne corroboree TaxID=495146 RepID=UPI0030816A38
MSWLSSENGIEAEELEDVYHELSQLADDGLSAATYESDTDKKGKKKKSSNPPRSQNSPYLSSTKMYPRKAPVWRSLKGTGQMHTQNPMIKVPRQLWLASLKQGNGFTQPVKVDSDIGQAWASPSSSTPEYLKEALGMKKPKYSRSASTGYIPGTPDFKEKEDMYDQIIDLKKTLQAQKSDGDIMKTKLRRLEEENSRKDRQIEQLLDPSRSSEFSRSLVDKRSDSSVIVNNLKQKILKLEKQCKEKDATLSKLQTDLKTTSVEEMKIAMETYYEEIQRLQTLLAKAEAAQQRPPPESRDSLKRQKALSTALLKLSKQVKELQDENKSLKTDLDRAMAPSPTSFRSKGYSEWSKQRLVRKISELEKKLENLENPNVSSTEQTKSSRVTVIPNSDQGDGTPNPKSELQEECDRLKNLVKKIKEDRAALQERLGTKESENKRLQQEKTDLERQLQRLKDKKDDREEINRLNQKIKRLEAQLEDERREKETMKKSQDESPGSYPSSARSSPSTSSARGSFSSSSGREKRRKQEAAQLIQKNWKRYKSRKEENDDLEESAMFLQAALRGHLARQKMLSATTPHRLQSPRANSLLRQDSTISDGKHGPDPSAVEDDHVTFLQSAFRAHVTRTKMLGQRPSEMKGRESPGRRSPRDNTRSPSENTKPSRERIRSPRENTRSPVSWKSSSQDVRYSRAGGSSGDVSEDCIQELSSEEEEEETPAKKPVSYSSLSQRSPSVSGKTHSPVEDSQSDDSDDIIVVSPSRPARRKDSHF